MCYACYGWWTVVGRALVSSLTDKLRQCLHKLLQYRSALSQKKKHAGWKLWYLSSFFRGICSLMKMNYYFIIDIELTWRGFQFQNRSTKCKRNRQIIKQNNTSCKFFHIRNNKMGKHFQFMILYFYAMHWVIE